MITENPARVSTLLVCSGKGPASLEGVKVFCCQSTSTSQGREFVSRKHPVSNQEEAAWVQIGGKLYPGEQTKHPHRRRDVAWDRLGSTTLVSVMESADLRNREHTTLVRRLHGPGLGRIFAQG